MNKRKTDEIDASTSVGEMEPSTSTGNLRKKHYVDRYCRNCSAFKKVKLNTEGLCDICSKRRTCSICKQRRQDKFFKEGKDLCTTCERRQASPQVSNVSSVQNTFAEEGLHSAPNAVDAELVIRDLESSITDSLERSLTENGPLKWYVGLEVHFNRENPDGSTMTTVAYFQSIPTILLNPTQTLPHLEDAINRFSSLIDSFTSDGSGWTTNHIGNVKLHTATYDPVGGSSYIKSPPWLAAKKATVNIVNNDNYCFFVFCGSCFSSSEDSCRTC